MYTHLKQAAWTGEIEMVEGKLYDPLRWRRPRRVFVNSMSDLFYEALPVDDVARIFAVMVLAQKHTFQVLTKRTAWMQELLSRTSFWERVYEFAQDLQSRSALKSCDFPRGKVDPTFETPAHIWLGASVENQSAAEERLHHLIRTPCKVRWLSCEPLIGPVALNFQGSLKGKIQWIVVGGESGARG